MSNTAALLQDDDAPRGVRPRPSIYTYHRYPNPITRLKRDQVQLREPPLDRRQRVYLAVISGPGVAAGPADSVVVVKKIKGHRHQPEASMLRQVEHPNVVRLLGICPADPAYPDDDVWLVMEKAIGDMRQTILRDPHGRFSAAEVLFLMLQVSEALVHLHTRMRCAHLDLKPDNILLFQKGGGDWVAKIADFGAALSLRAPDALDLNEHTLQYAAPEQLTSCRLRSYLEGFACDIYAFGGVLFEALTGGTVNRPDGSVRLYEIGIRSAALTPRWGSLEPTIRDQLLGLCATCTATDSSRRPSALPVRDSLARAHRIVAGHLSDVGAVRSGDGRGFIVPRDGYLSQLRDSLASHSVTVLHGPPGMGKSVLARRHAEACLTDYCHVLEAWGASAAPIVEDLFEAVNLTLLPLLQPQGAVTALDYKSVRGGDLAAVRALKQLLQRARVRLDDPRPFLILLDGVDDMAGMDGVLRELIDSSRPPAPDHSAVVPRPSIVVLVTTIAPPPSFLIPTGVNLIPVEAFDDDDVLTLLSKTRLLSNLDEAVVALRKATGMRPWAVARLVAIAACTGRSLVAEAETLLRDAATVSDAIDAGIRARCREAIRSRLEDFPSALRLYDNAMSFCSCSATLDLSPMLLRAVQHAYDPSRSPDAGQTDALDDVGRVATILAEVTTTANGSLHQLDLDPSAKDSLLASQHESPCGALRQLRPMFITLEHQTALCGSWRPVVRGLVTLTSVLQRVRGVVGGRDILIRNSGAIECEIIDDLQAVVFAAGEVLKAAFDFGSSFEGVCVTLAQNALHLEEALTNPTARLKLSQSLDTFGRCGMRAGSDTDGRATLLKAQQTALDIRRQVYAGVDHPDLAESLNNVGLTVTGIGARDGGMALLREALEMRRRLYAGMDHPHLAESLNNVGGPLEAMGDRAAGVALLREALEMHRRLYAGVDHPHLATSLNNVGSSLEAMGACAAGVALKREALEMQRRLHAGVDDPHLAASLNNVGGSVEAMGDRAAGLALQREALEMQRRLHAGVDHSHLATSLCNVGSSLVAMGDLAGGVALQRDALAMFRRLYAGVDHPHLAASLNKLGSSLVASGDRAAGLVLQREALDMRRRLSQA